MQENKIKTFEDACKALNVEFNPPAGLTPDEIAYKQLKIVNEALNEGWKPNWNDWNEWKYYPWFKMGNKGAGAGVGFSFDGFDIGDATSHVGSRLCYKSSELAEYAGNQFLEIYKAFYLIPTVSNEKH